MTTDITLHITENDIRAAIGLFSFILGAVVYGCWESFRKSTFGG